MDELKDLIAEQIPRLRRYARALVGGRAQADDLVQDTLERGWARRHLWRRGSDPRAWLFTIMHNLHVNQVRSRVRAPGLTPLEDNAPEHAWRPAAEEALIVRDLARALEQLPPEYRETVLLIGLEQMSYQEAAEVLGVPVGTVMSRLARGRERLRALMSGQTQPTLRRVK